MEIKMSKYCISKEWSVICPKQMWFGIPHPERKLTVRLCAFVSESADQNIYLVIESKDDSGFFYGFDDTTSTLQEVKLDNGESFLKYFSNNWLYDFDQYEIANELSRLISWMEEQSN